MLPILRLEDLKPGKLYVAYSIDRGVCEQVIVVLAKASLFADIQLVEYDPVKRRGDYFYYNDGVDVWFIPFKCKYNRILKIEDKATRYKKILNLFCKGVRFANVSMAGNTL